MIFPSFDEFEKIADEYNLIPVWQELPGDMDTPISLYQKFKNDGACYLLESVEGGERLARYSFIGIEPLVTITAKSGEVIIEKPDKVIIHKNNPISEIERIMGQYRVFSSPALPRFYGGFVGFIGYDSVKYFEEIQLKDKDELLLPDCCFVLTRVILIYDHVQGTIKIVTLVEPGKSKEDSYQAAIKTIAKIREGLNKPVILEVSNAQVPEEMTFYSNISKNDFLTKVNMAKEYIAAGDIFQVVLSQRFETEPYQSAFEIYRNLRRINPSPYMFYLDFPGCQIVGASPEMLVRVEDGMVQTHPIAGTRKRGTTQELDQELALELLADEKECAEHLMLVDLGRNDVGRVSKPGTVNVTKFSEVERFSHVMHLVSVVEGQLNEEKNAFDALKACFPAGTVSGAPKVRAMEIIDELEPTNRGIYAGAVAYVGFNGNQDSCIAIRTVVLTGNKAYVQAGAGIVADSQPEKEYEETVNKAKAVMQAVCGKAVKINVAYGR